MTTAWTLPAADIISDALSIVGVLGAGETASADDANVCMTALQNIIKELPLHGVSWPKVTASPVALAWSASTPAQVALPADYFGAPVVSYAVNGATRPVEVIAKAAYDALPPAGGVTVPQKIYIAPNNQAFLWPVPESDPGLSLTYQAIASDVDIASRPDVAQSWLSGLGYWLAYEICPKFGVDMASRQDIEKRFLIKRRLMLAYAAESAPITFGVAD